MVLKITVLLLITQGAFVLAGLHFRLGRSKGGNLGAPFVHVYENLPEPKWFQQKLDHFTPTDLRTWKQRYFVNDTFYNFENPGPVFLMIGGEGPADARWMVKGAWIEYAKRFNALCINLEHRYYGESHPTENLSVKNLIYLSSHQALADLANFVSAMNQKYQFKKNVRWIAFGGSYPGSLAAWFRLKYPHLVYAAISSSGPLLAKVNFMEYFEVVVAAIHEKTGGDECVNQIKKAHKQVNALVKSEPSTIEKKFRLCQPFKNATRDDMKNFYNSIADDFADLVQYNEDKRISSSEQYRNLTINTVCAMLTEPGEVDALDRLALFHSLMLDATNQTCMDYNYKSMIQTLRNTDWANGEGGRQWTYQTCTEFGFYQTSSGAVEVFGNNFTLDFFIQQCQDIFGKKYNKQFIDGAVEWSNRAYGGLRGIMHRVLFVHGSVDPWHALGVTNTTHHDAPAIYIKGTAHCANMYPPSEDDSSALKDARVKVQEYLSHWITT